MGSHLVLGVLFGSVFGAVTLASTGDWMRFGKGLGVNILGGVVARAGAAAGGVMGAPLGPIGITLGTLIGGVSGHIAIATAG